MSGRDTTREARQLAEIRTNHEAGMTTPRWAVSRLLAELAAVEQERIADRFLAEHSETMAALAKDEALGGSASAPRGTAGDTKKVSSYHGAGQPVTGTDSRAADTSRPTTATEPLAATPDSGSSRPPVGETIRAVLLLRDSGRMVHGELDFPYCLPNAARKRAVAELDALTAERDKAVSDYMHGTQKWVDGTCHYRNLAISLGAKPDTMLDRYDRELAEKHDPSSPDGWEHDTVEVWQELEAAEARVAVLTAERAAIEAHFPATLYAHLPLLARVEVLVSGWRRAVVAESTLDARVVELERELAELKGRS